MPRKSGQRSRKDLNLALIGYCGYFHFSFWQLELLFCGQFTEVLRCSADTSRAQSRQTLVLNYLCKLAGCTLNVQPANLHKIFSRFKVCLQLLCLSESISRIRVCKYQIFLLYVCILVITNCGSSYKPIVQALILLLLILAFQGHPTRLLFLELCFQILLPRYCDYCLKKSSEILRIKTKRPLESSNQCTATPCPRTFYRTHQGS